MNEKFLVNLKTAKSILEEVGASTSNIQDFIARKEAAMRLSEDHFWQGLKQQAGIYQEINSLDEKLNNVLKVAEDVKSKQHNLEYTEQNNTYTPDSLIAGAYFQKGILCFARENNKEALNYFQKTLKHNEDPVAYYYVGLAYSLTGEKELAINSFQIIIDKYSESEVAIEANKEILALKNLKVRKWKTALLLSIFLGMVGADRFYLGDFKKGLWKFFTGGGIYIWWIVDIIRIATNNMRDVNGFRLEK